MRRPRTASGWIRCAVQILTGSEDHPTRRWVNGYTHPDAPGLVVTPTTAHDAEQVRCWSVTHRDSGREIAELTNERSAKKAALRLAPLAAWDGPLEALQVDGEHIADAVQVVVAGAAGRVTTLQPSYRRQTRAVECEAKAVRYLLEALKVHEHRNDVEAAARIRATLATLPQ